MDSLRALSKSNTNICCCSSVVISSLRVCVFLSNIVCMIFLYCLFMPTYVYKSICHNTVDCHNLARVFSCTMCAFFFIFYFKTMAYRSENKKRNYFDFIVTSCIINTVNQAIQWTQLERGIFRRMNTSFIWQQHFCTV